MTLTVPCAIALIVIPVPLISVLFERGAFGADDTAATALALAVYGLGLPAFVLQKVLQPLYFSREDTVTPFKYAVVSLVVNATVAIGLSMIIGFLAAAIGTTLAAWAMVWLLQRGVRQMGPVAQFDQRYRKRLWRIVFSSLLMGVILWGVYLLLGPLLGTAGWRYGALAVLVASGIFSYALIGQALGAFYLRELRETIRRG